MQTPIIWSEVHFSWPEWAAGATWSAKSLSENPSWANMKENNERSKLFSFNSVSGNGHESGEEGTGGIDGSGRGCAASAAMGWSNLGFRIGSGAVQQVGRPRSQAKQYTGQ
jgi:hypothetical protein